MLATRLSEGLGQTVVIDNRAGAGGNIAAEIVARSVPDGYTMLLGNNGILAVNVSLYPKLAFDPVKDFAPVVLVASQPNIVWCLTRGTKTMLLPVGGEKLLTTAIQ